MKTVLKIALTLVWIFIFVAIVDYDVAPYFVKCKDNLVKISEEHQPVPGEVYVYIINDDNPYEDTEIYYRYVVDTLDNHVRYLHLSDLPRGRSVESNRWFSVGTYLVKCE